MSERRAAGVLTLLFLAASGVHFGVFEQPLLPTRAPAEVAAYLTGNPVHARAGALLDLFLFGTGVALAVVLSRLVRAAGPGLAQLVLALMLVSFGVAVAIELSTFAALSLARSSELAGLAAVLSARSEGYAVVMLFYAPALGGWAWLARRDGVLPRALALTGAGACALMLAATGAKIVAPAAMEAAVTAASMLVMVFQLASGVALLRRST